MSQRSFWIGKLAWSYPRRLREKHRTSQLQARKSILRPICLRWLGRFRFPRDILWGTRFVLGSSAKSFVSGNHPPLELWTYFDVWMRPEPMSAEFHHYSTTSGKKTGCMEFPRSMLDRKCICRSQKLTRMGAPCLACLCHHGRAESHRYREPRPDREYCHQLE